MTNQTSTKDKLVDYGLMVAAGFAIYFFGSKVIAKAKHDTVESQLGTDPSAQIAQQLRACFNPSGQSWLMWTDGTSTDAVMALAPQIKDFGKVASSYNALYKSSLADDLTNELSGQELTRFYGLIPSSKTIKPVSKTSTSPINIGDEIMSNPRPGFTKIGYYEDPTGVSTLKILYWHNKPKSYVGKVVKSLKKTFKVNGKDTVKLMLGVNAVPMNNMNKTRVMWVFEEEVLPLKR
jgi:hypothetical protein